LSQTEIYSEMVFLATMKSNINISEDSLKSDANRLTNQLWKLIPMKENGEDWSDQLNTVLIEIRGLSEIFYEEDKFLILLSKLEGLKASEDLDFLIYRKTVFESISLLREMLNG
jgi:hypothetical protein